MSTDQEKIAALTKEVTKLSERVGDLARLVAVLVRNTGKPEAILAAVEEDKRAEKLKAEQENVKRAKELNKP